MASKKVAIIGAGICGVSSAICLQTEDPSLEITIIAEKFSPNLTSDGAAGLWDPVYLKCPIIKQKRWGKITFDYLRSILDTEEAHKYQMTYTTLFELYDQEVEKSPLSNIFPYYNRLSKDDLRKNNFPADIIDGFMVKSIMFPATPYLNIKLKEFQQRGGKVIQKKVNSFDELAGKYDVVVNCAGIGSHDLCSDDAVTPLRGQVLKMKAPWIKHGYFMSRQRDIKQEQTTYIFPRFNDIIVGGTFQAGNWNTNIDDEQTQSILERAAELVPTIKHAVLIKPWVGLRPLRDTLRLERETLQVSIQYGTKSNLQVVHNYGHGGAGLSLFWGCAQDVKDLVMSSLFHSVL